MSRSALWRQEGNVKERQRRADEIFETACAEGRSRSKSTLAFWGPDNDTFHMNPLLLQNTIQSSYFQKCCTNLNDWNAIIDEIYYEVKHLHVFQLGTTPSTAFCLLTRLLCFRMTSHELEQTITHPDSPYIRAIGFLFIRFGGCPVEQVLDRITPFLHDETELDIEPQGKQQKSGKSTIGDFVRKVFQEREYYEGQTPLPRFPIHLEREILVKLLAADKIAHRAKQHASDGRRMEYFQTIGSTIQALYGDDDNPIAWYRAVIDRVIATPSVQGPRMKYPKFVVTFTEYGNTETVSLGEIDVLGPGGNVHPSSNSTNTPSATSSNKSLDDHRGPADERGLPRSSGRGTGSLPPNGRRGHANDDRQGTHRERDERFGPYDHSSRKGRHAYHDQPDHRRRNDGSHRFSNNADSSRPDTSLYDEIRQAEQDRVTSSDKAHWARRPPSTKRNLSAPAGTAGGARNRGSSPVNSNLSGGRGDEFDHKYRQQGPSVTPSTSTATSTHLEQRSSCPTPPPRKRTAEELAAIEDKKRKLLSKYG